jgi:hypothetical protein
MGAFRPECLRADQAFQNRQKITVFVGAQFKRQRIRASTAGAVWRRAARHRVHIRALDRRRYSRRNHNGQQIPIPVTNRAQLPDGKVVLDFRRSYYRAAMANAVVAQLVAVAEMNWSRP